MMNITLKGLHMPLTDALKQYSHDKLQSLEKFIHQNALVHVEIGKPSKHHKAGPDVFHAEITIDSNGHNYFVQITDADLYVAIDRATTEILEMIKQGRGKRQTLIRKGRMALKELARKGFYGWNK
jgi:ribosomal subunit interface protein